ncbi:PhaM family polyhydroxyalkanoate granule multifunctional regulatory protein [Undibacterium sp. Di27W]|uniref:PhaM family polyhydroxyalkanoate granule multifunctional regulatory protein n=1 Tax=Undibacterium sp. Di27W TaxID=3413036 RepID=UPI003BF2748B
MSNPFSGSEIPGMNAMGDTLSFVKKLWGNMQVPGMVAPPMSVDELDKKIQDLKTVESWLTVNMNMLRGTIQALEVQRATLAALQSLGESFAQHAQQAGAMAEQAATPFSARPATTEEAHSNANWPMHPSTDKPESAAGKIPEPDPDTEVDEDEDMPPDASEVKAEPKSEVHPNNSDASADAPEQARASDASAPFANPAAWWGLLQEQFKQAVSKAMETEQTVSTSAETDVKKTAEKKSAATNKSATKPKVASTTKTGIKTGTKTDTKAGATATNKVVPKVTTKTTGKPASKSPAKPVTKATGKPGKATK